jgi:hypothetical protein
MSDFDISNIQDEGQVEITDLDPEVDDTSASVSILFLRFVRKLTLCKDPRDRFILLVYLTCAVIVLFMIEPDLPVMPKQTSGTSAQELHDPLAIYPFVIKDTSSAHTETWIRISNGQIIVIQAIPGKIGWHNCKVQRRYTPPKYVHPLFVVCT